MFLRRKLIFVVAVCFALGLTKDASASGSGALRNEAPDAGALGKGSAFVGEANRASAVYYNPAGLTQLKSKEVSEGFAGFFPLADYENTSGQETQMRRQTFFIPHFYAVLPIDSSKFVLGFGATSYFGLGTYWAEDSYSKYVDTKSDMKNKDFMLTAAYKATDQLSLGAGVDIDDSNVSLNKKLLQIGQGDGNFQLKAKSVGWGYRLATLYKFNDQNQAGLMYRSTIRHKYHGKAYLDDLQAGAGVTNYLAFFGGSSYETDVSEDFVLPQSVVMGYSFKPNSKWTFNLDVEWMDWSSVKQEFINWESETDPTRLAILNSGNPVARDWIDVWSESIGAEYAMTDGFRLRAGYFHHQTPIPEATFQNNLPDSNKNGITAGFGWDMTKALTFDFAYCGIFYRPRKVTNDVGSASLASINGKYTQFVNVFLATLSCKF